MGSQASATVALQTMTAKDNLTMTKAPEKCPFCGASVAYMSISRLYADWSCRSFKHGEDPTQSVECKLNVAEAVVERLREALEKTKGHLRYSDNIFYTEALGYQGNVEQKGGEGDEIPGFSHP